MKSSQKGFLIPILLIIVAVVALSGGAYYYSKNKSNVDVLYVPTYAPNNHASTTTNTLLEGDSKETSITILNLNDEISVNSDQPFTLKWSIKNPPTDKENWKFNIGLKPLNASEFAYLEDVPFKSSEGSYTLKSLDGIYQKGTMLSVKVCLTQNNLLGKPLKVKMYCTSAPGHIQVSGSNNLNQKIDNIVKTDLNSWKLYNNKKYGFKFNYPSVGDWYADDSIDSSVKGEGTVKIERCPSDYCEGLITIGTYSKTVEQKVADYKKYWVTDNQKGRFTIEIQTADSKLTRLKTTDELISVHDSLSGGGDVEIIYIITDPRNSNHTLTIEIDPDNRVLSPDEYVATINKILGSIEFL